MSRPTVQPEDPDTALDTLPILLTVPQAAALAQVGVNRVHDWTRLPGFPAIRTAHMVRIHARLFEQWLADWAKQSAEEGAA